jgi:decaprenylphospho-beta-D-erythro-pentofuranosid-2-ulose 2-reductase
MRDALGSVQSVLVLGGTSEIAQAVVRRLVADRVRTVVLAARDVARAEPAAAELRSGGATFEVVELDVTRLETHRDVIDAAFDRHGDLDVVLVAAGALGRGGDDQLDDAAELMLVNATGPISCVVPAVERLRRQGHGSLVVLSSVAAERPRASNYAYGASKAGLDAFARGLGDVLRGSGVDVMVVRPGFVRTRMTRHLDAAPLSVDADTVAEAVVDGLRRRAAIVHVPAAMRWVMLVLRLLPGAIFRRLPI